MLRPLVTLKSFCPSSRYNCTLPPPLPLERKFFQLPSPTSINWFFLRSPRDRREEQTSFGLSLVRYFLTPFLSLERCKYSGIEFMSCPPRSLTGSSFRLRLFARAPFSFLLISKRIQGGPSHFFVLFSVPSSLLAFPLVTVYPGTTCCLYSVVCGPQIGSDASFQPFFTPNTMSPYSVFVPTPSLFTVLLLTRSFRLCVTHFSFEETRIPFFLQRMMPS